MDDKWFNAFSAIGQWVGAIATALVAYLAIRQGRPRIRILSETILKFVSDLDEYGNPKESGHQAEYLQVKVINVGYVPVRISGIGIRVPKSLSKEVIQLRLFNEKTGMLYPGEDVYADFHVQLLKDNQIQNMDLGYAVDNLGRLYYERVALLRAIARQWQWRR